MYTQDLSSCLTAFLAPQPPLKKGGTRIKVSLFQEDLGVSDNLCVQVISREGGGNSSRDKYATSLHLQERGLERSFPDPVKSQPISRLQLLL